jgi:hypothetical protein
MATSAIPRAIFGDQGFLAPDEDAILAGAQADIDTAFGGGLDPDLSTPEGQIASTETAIVGNKNAQFLWFCSQVDPAFNSGRMQDGIGRIYFIDRIAGRPTVQSCVCTGLVNTTIPTGALAEDPDTGVQWTTQQATTIPIGGSVTVNFAAIVNGPTVGPVTLDIKTTVFGWDTVTPSGGATIGRNVESRSEFEDRRRLSTAKNSTGHLPSIRGTVLGVTGVSDAFVTENNTGSPQTIGGVSIAATSLYVAALGGTDLDVATAIWTKKAPGCGYNGNTTVNVFDPGQSIPPYPVTFTRPSLVSFAAVVTIDNSVLVPSDAQTQVQNAIIGAFAGADGGSRAKIGTVMLASRYYAPVVNLGIWAAGLVNLKIGRRGGAATISGTISGSTLTAGTLTSGTLAVGQLLSGTGVTVGTLISGLLSGTGGVGTYSVSVSQTAPVETIVATSLVDSVTLNINEAPVIAPADISLTLV